MQRWRVVRLHSVLQSALFATIASLALVPATEGQNLGGSFLRMTFVDVGQGDAIWIQEADGWNGRRGANLIIDGEPDTGPRNRLIKFLQDRSYGLKGSDVIDCMVATHPHLDHYAGLTDVLDQ